MAHLGEILKDFRKRNELSQTQMAESIGVSLRAYQKYEKSGIVAKSDILKRIENLLNKKAHEVSHGTLSEPRVEYKGSTQADWLRRLDQLIENNRMLSEAQLLLAEHINSGRAAGYFPADQEEDEAKAEGVQVLPPLGTKGTGSRRTSAKGRGSD